MKTYEIKHSINYNIIFSFYFSRKNHEVPSIESDILNLGHPDDQEASNVKAPVWKQVKIGSIWHQPGWARGVVHLLTTGEVDGQKQFMNRLGKGGGHSRMMKIEGN